MAVSGVLQFYRTVIDDVLNNVRETFLDDGIDEQVLVELKQIWESKLMQSKAVPAEHAPPVAEPPQPVVTQHQHQQVVLPVSMPAPTQNVTLAQQTTIASVVHQPVQYYTTAATGQTGAEAGKTVTFTLPQTVGAGQKPVTITLPAHLMQHAGAAGIVMSSSAAAAAQALPANMTAGLLQSPLQINAQGLITQQQPDGTTVSYQAMTAEQLAKQGYVVSMAPGVATPTTTAHTQMHTMQLASMRTFQTAAADQQQKNKPSGVIQLDGANDTSDDDDDDLRDDDDDNDVDDDDINEDENDGIGEEEEPLNSEDDVSDEDASELFDTDNVIVCQYDKITRSRNKWKFHLKDGIMNVQGKDYVFQKASGDAEW